MKTVKVHDKNFTKIYNSALRDPELSLKSVGLLAYMLSMPEGYDLSIRGVASKKPDGIDGVQSAMKELKDKGYILRCFKSDGKKIETYLQLAEIPFDFDSSYSTSEDGETRCTENPDTGKPVVRETPTTSTKDCKVLKDGKKKKTVLSSSLGEAEKTNKPDPSNPRYAAHKKIALAAYEQMGKMVLPSNPIISNLMGVIQDCADCWSLDQQADLLPKIITQMVEHRTSLPADHPDKQKDPIYNLPAFLKYQGRGSAADHPYGSALSRERAEPEKEDFTPAPEMQEAINAILVGKEMPSSPNYKMLRDALPELGPHRRVKPVKRVRKKLTEEERRELLLKMDPPDTRIPEVVG